MPYRHGRKCFTAFTMASRPPPCHAVISLRGSQCLTQKGYHPFGSFLYLGKYRFHSAAADIHIQNIQSAWIQVSKYKSLVEVPLHHVKCCLLIFAQHPLFSFAHMLVQRSGLRCRSRGCIIYNNLLFSKSHVAPGIP